MESVQKPANLHAGHRDRLRALYRRNGAEALEAHQLLELLLFYAIPYRDTNPLAHRLINRFGSLWQVLNASEEELCGVGGVGVHTARLLRCLPQTEARVLSAKGAPRYTTLGQVGRFMTARFAERQEASAAMMLLDHRSSLIGFLFVEGGGPYRAGFSVRNLIEPALRRGAAGVVLAYRRFGSAIAVPDANDLRIASEIGAAMASAGVAVIDQLLIAGTRYASLRLKAIGRFNAEEKTDVGERDDFSEDEEALARLLWFGGAEQTASRAFAATLLERFGSFTAVLSAPPDSLTAECGIGERTALFLSMLLPIAARACTDDAVGSRMPGLSVIRSYFLHRFLGVGEERVLLLLLDRRMRFLDCPILCRGTVDGVSFQPRKAHELALSRRAGYAVLAHNHPGGTTEPSVADRSTTAALLESLAAIDVTLLEHLIVAGNECRPILRELPGCRTPEAFYRGES